MKATLLKILLFIQLLFLMHSVPAQTRLWGLTSEGGTNNHGTLGYYDPATSTWTTEFNFEPSNPGIGARPFYTNLVEVNGKMYGLTSEGGVNDVGVLFEWDPATNVYSKKVDFAVLGDKGWNPRGSLTYANGKLYGLTMRGGANNLGVLFEWDPTTNIYTKKIDFNGINGSVPRTTMVHKDGKLFGFSGDGGANNYGVLFEWDIASNIFTKKVDLTISNRAPFSGSPIYYGGKFYVSANGIYEWDGASNYIKKFTSTVSTPTGQMTLYNDKFYGIAGTIIYEWDPVTNIYTKKLDNLAVVVGSQNIQGTLSYENGKFYGVSYEGGTGGSTGALFEWNPTTNIATKKLDFSPANGANSYSSLTSFAGKLYGMTYLGGTNSDGVIFEWNPETNNYTKKIDFTSSKDNGYIPYGSLSFYNGKFYGMTSFGGELVSNGSLSGHGVVFEWDPVTKINTQKKVLTFPMGRYPKGHLTHFNGKVYGMTPGGGGATGGGVIFEWDPSTNEYFKRVEFVGIEGAGPYGSLTLVDGKLYGMAGRGANNKGVIFEFNPTTKVYTKKFDFDGTNGASPDGTLTYHEGKLYGMTARGGLHNGGVIFELDPTTGIFVKKVDINPTTAGFPQGSLTYYQNKFYGMTNYGGLVSDGVIFEWDPSTNILLKRIDLIGYTPYGSLTASGNKLYGVTSTGGIHNRGVLFEWDPLTNVHINKISFNLETGGAPYYTQLLETVVQDQEITFQSLSPKVYGDADFTLSASSSSGLPISYLSSNASIVTVVGNIVKIIGAGTVTITAKQSGSLFFNPATDVTQSLVVNKADQSITFGTLTEKLVNDASFALSATSSSGLPVTYISSNSAVATLSGNNVTITGAGSTTITAAQNGNGNYNAAPSVERILIVNKQSQSITFPTIATKTIGDAPFTLTASASSNLPVSYSTTSSNITIANTQVTMLTAGQATIKAIQSGNTVFSSAAEVSQTFCINPVKPIITLSTTDAQSSVLTSSSPIGNQWFRNGLTIQGANNMTLNVTSEGVYSVEVNIETCQSERSSEQSIIITGDIPIIVDKNFSIYPNPAKEKLIIDLKLFESHKTVEIYIYDNSGKVVQTLVTSGDRLLEVPIGQYSTGKYIIKAAQGDKISNQHFIKE